MAKKSDAITDRQQKILQAIIDEYTERAEPVSSQCLEAEYDFGIRGAMIRREMQELEDMGYLLQPHTSAGRIPTGKGYRLAVDAIMQKKRLAAAKNEVAIAEEDIIPIMYRLTQEIAQESGAFTLGYLTSTHIAWKEGWEELLRQPEFEKGECVSKFVDFLEALQEYFEELPLLTALNVFIGQEHPFAKNSEFSTLIASHPFSGGETGLLALVGPIRMPYKQNIALLESLPFLIQKLTI